MVSGSSSSARNGIRSAGCRRSITRPMELFRRSVMFINLPKAVRLSAPWMTGRGLFEDRRRDLQKSCRTNLRTSPRYGLWETWSKTMVALPEGQFARFSHSCWNCGADQGGELELRHTGAGSGCDGWYRNRWHLHADLRSKWQEAMNGSISLYDRHSERLHTIYVGAAPEYGKVTLFNRIEHEIDHVRSLYPTRQGRRRAGRRSAFQAFQ